MSSKQLESWLRQVETCVSVSLSVSLYIKGDADTVKAGMLQCWEDYRKRWGDKLRWLKEDDTRKYREASDRVLEYPRRRLTSRRPSTIDVYWSGHGGREPRDASPWLFKGVLLRVPETADELHAVRASRDTATEEVSTLEFLEMVREWASWLPVFHGYAGYAFNESVSTGPAQRHQKHVLAASRRFVGIEVEDTSGTSMYVLDGIKSVNWLTLVSDELLSKLGGAEALRERFSDAIVLHPIRDGLMIQAGPKPELGDVNQEDSLPHYREVMRVLRPIRVAWHPDFGHADLGSFGPVETDEWMRRLDD